jgi:phosphoglycolate phosphatase
MKRLILYDLDGTLAETLQDIAEAINHMLGRLGAPVLPVQEVRRAVGRGMREMVAQCLRTTDPARIEDGVRLLRGYYGEHLLDHTRLYPGVREVLEHFHSRHQAVITNKPQDFYRRILDGLDVSRFFVEIIGGDAGYPHKPDPAAALELMRQLEIAPHETVFVGDSLIDVETARRAEVGTVVVLTHGFSDEAQLREASPHFVLSGFNELLMVARQREW